MPKTLKIMNNEARVHTIGHGYKDTAGGAGKQAQSVRLLPGLNEVDARSWEAAAKLPVVAHMLENGTFSQVGGSSDSSGLSDLQTSDALSMVSSTLDRDLLRTWARTEKREAVVNAIEAQVGKITNSPSLAANKSGVEGMDFKAPKPPNALSGGQVTDEVKENAMHNYDEAHSGTSSRPDGKSSAEVQRQLHDVPAPNVTKPNRR